MANYEFKTSPFKHQLDALSRSACKKNFAYFMEMGCFDGKTEFLTNRGWVPFECFDLEKWKRPLLVAQAIPRNLEQDTTDWAFEFTEPLSFIKKPAENWARMTMRPGKGALSYSDIVCTPDHVIPCTHTYYTCTGSKGDYKAVHNPSTHVVAEATPEWIYKSIIGDDKRKPKYGRDQQVFAMPFAAKGGLLGFDSEYYEPNELNGLSEFEIKFMVAVVADGTYPNIGNNKVDFYFKKERKAKRLQMLAAKAGIPMAYEKKIIKTGDTVHVFHAIAPVRYKVFNQDWYNLPQKALRWVAEEVFYWDGFIENGEAQYVSIMKESTDFVQYALFASGAVAKLGLDYGKGLWRIRLSFKQCGVPGLVPDNSAFAARKELISRELPTILTDVNGYVRNVELFNEEMMSYCFRVPSGYLVLRRENKIFIASNSGKTKVMIDNIAMLHEAGHVSAALILAPKGVYRNWSEKEIPTHLPDRIEHETLVWKADATDTAKKRLLDQINNWDGKKLQLMVFNIESLISDKGKKLLQAFIKRHDGNVFALVDESTCIKNHKAKRTKEAVALGKLCKVRRIATGSPVTNSPLDLFSQCSFLDTSLLKCGSFYAFKNTYANIERIQNRQGQHYEKILSYKNLDKLSELLDKFSFRVTKNDCLDLPDKVYVTRDVDLTPEQLKIYKEMQDYQFALLKKEDAFEEMSAQVVLTKLLRLHQVLCGTFTSDDGTIHRLANNRIQALEDVLEETRGKVIIWATYLADIYVIRDMLTEKYGKDSFVTYYGETKNDERVRAIELFQDESSPVRFFLGNVQTAGRGITLTAASTVVYYSNNFSLELRQQSEDRAHRLGQKNKVTYIDLVVRGSLDEKIIKSLIEKRNIANEILKDDLAEWISLQPG